MYTSRGKGAFILKKHLTLRLVVALLMIFIGVAHADGGINTGDTAWVLISTALVLFMTPGLGLFYAGMVRRKNVLGTILQSFIAIGVVGILWAVFGFSLTFGADHGGFVGGLEWLGLKNVSAFNAWPGTGISSLAFMAFQGMFAIITVALITGAFAERMKFSVFLIFSVLWSTLVYCPVAHWIWQSDGWLFKLGAIDFAGGTAVHICSGIAALCCAIVLGKRIGHGRQEFKPHNLTMTLVGTAILWFGWFGFNAGSALGANGVAVNAFVVTHLAACAGAVSWLLIEWLHRGKPTALGAASGAVAGLVAITPASGYVGPMAAIVIGLVVGVLCYSAIMLKGRFGYDDSLDVFGVHCVGGIWGSLATGIFASKAINSAGANGLLHGNPALLGKQVIAVVAVLAYSFTVTFVLLKVISLITPLRVTKSDEETGLDLSQHGEVGYDM